MRAVNATLLFTPLPPQVQPLLLVKVGKVP